jgi:hypothetical protein
MEEPLDLDWNPLPSNLKNAFLGENQTPPVITATNLTKEQVQKCMMGICSEMGEKLEKIFMDEFSIFGSTFSESLHYLDFILKRVKETSKTVRISC